MLPMQGAQVQSLVKELDPTCCNILHAESKMLFITTKSWHTQISKKKKESTCQCRGHRSIPDLGATKPTGVTDDGRADHRGVFSLLSPEQSSQQVTRCLHKSAVVLQPLVLLGEQSQRQRGQVLRSRSSKPGACLAVNERHSSPASAGLQKGCRSFWQRQVCFS